MPNLKSRFKQLGKDSIIYGLGGVIARGMGFFLLPLYTRFFIPADYGVIETLNVIMSFLGVLLVFGMDSAQSYFFFQQKDSGKAAQARVITSVLQFRLTWSLLVILLGMLVSPLLNAQFFDGQLSLSYFLVVFLGALFTQVASQSADVFRLLYRPWVYIGITLSNAIISALASVALVGWLKLGIYGYFIGSAFGSLMAAMIGWQLGRSYIDWSGLHFDWWPKLVRFGAPFVPMALGMYVLNTADRWFIIRYQDQTVLGLYAVADKFAVMLALLVTTFRQAWWPIAMDAIQTKDGPVLLKMMGRLYLGLASIGVIWLTALSPFFVQWLTTPEYYPAYMLIGVLALQPLNYGLQLIVGIGIWKAEKTIWSPIGLGVAALINIALAFWLVPLYGGMGAAIATAIAYFFWNVITLLLSERFWPVGYPIGIFAIQTLIALLASAAILYIGPEGGIWKLALTALAGTLFVLGITIKPSQVHWLVDEYKRYMNRRTVVTGEK